MDVLLPELQPGGELDQRQAEVVLALGVAVVGVVISTVAFGDFPFLSLVIALNWSVYAALKKNVTVDGVTKDVEYNGNKTIVQL